VNHPPIPPDCPWFLKDGRFCPPGMSDWSDKEEEDDWLPIKCAVAFFYWTREAQRLKRRYEYELSTGAQVSAIFSYQAHLQAVQAAVGWAKWSGL
jgi:hypothetical protein